MTSHRGQAATDDTQAALSRLIDASADCIWILGSNGGIDCMNSAARRLFGTTGRSESWTAGWPEESRLTTERAFSTALDGRRSKFRFRHPGGDGALQYFDFTLNPMRDAQGEINQLLAVASDVTAQTESRAFLRTVVDALPQALTVHDLRSKKIVLANRSAEALSAVLPARDYDVAIAGPSRNTRTDILETATGPRCFSTLEIATYDDSGARHLISLSQDVTAEQADREATHLAVRAVEEAEQAKSAFLANMSHEIRTPLNGVVAGMDALRARLGVEEHRDLIDMARSSASTLAARIDELFAARPVAAERPLCSETIPLSSLLNELAHSFFEPARAKNLDLTVVAAPRNVPPDIVGDRKCLLSALRPLVDNAVKFTDSGTITISLDAFQDGWLRFSIIDTGVGFDPGLKDQLFIPFWRQDQSLTRRFGGLGLGLPSAQALAGRMGARIDAKPGREGGSIFWMDLPLSTAANASASEAAEEATSERLQILVADDHPTNRRVLELILDDLADVTSVVNGQEAVEATQAAQFDVILMDIQMPVMDGITAVAAIRKRERALSADPVPVIMLTANTEEEYVRASHAAGADRHVGKPFTAAALIEAIRAVQLERRNATRLAFEMIETQRLAS